MAAPYSDLQVDPAQYAEGSGLQVPDYSGLEHNGTEAYAPDLEDKTPSQPPPPRRTICGLAARTFWILLAVIIAIVVIGAAVGGGVGGSIAAKNSKNASNDAILSSSTSAQSAGTTPSPTSGSPKPSSAPTSSPSTGPITSSPTSTHAVTTTQIVESSTTLLSDCPSSNETLYSVNIGGEMTFRKLCSLGYVNAFGSTSVVNQRTTSLSDCINLCASYNVQDEAEIKLGDKLKCNTVCWRNGNDPSPGQCYGYTTTQNTSDVSVAIANPICDTGTWINPSF